MMKPSKKKYNDKQETLIEKLLNLKYRINDSYRGGERPDGAYDDKTWVVDRLDDVRNGKILSKYDMMTANKLWNNYNPSRMNNWEASNSRRNG